MTRQQRQRAQTSAQNAPEQTTPDLHTRSRNDMPATPTAPAETQRAEEEWLTQEVALERAAVGAGPFLGTTGQSRVEMETRRLTEEMTQLARERLRAQQRQPQEEQTPPPEPEQETSPDPQGEIANKPM